MAFGLQEHTLRHIFPTRFLCEGISNTFIPLHIIQFAVTNKVWWSEKSIYIYIFFFFQVGIAGIPADSVMKKTKIIEDNWIPTWNEEFEFPLTVLELALLCIEVDEYDMSDKDDFGGQTSLPVSELKTGIRAVPLHNHKGDKYKSVKLLMRFEFVWCIIDHLTRLFGCLLILDCNDSFLSLYYFSYIG